MDLDENLSDFKRDLRGNLSENLPKCLCLGHFSIEKFTRL